MSIATLKGKTVDVKLWIPIERVESEALTQLRNTASLPWAAHVLAMPDVHFGKGATVGSVIALRGAVAPAAVGVDPGCGMVATLTSLTRSELPHSTLEECYKAFTETIPTGFNAHTEPAWRRLSREIRDEASKCFEAFDELATPIRDVAGRIATAQNQLGTLGGGNHFLELGYDRQDRIWLVIHSGSRRLGLDVTTHHLQVAKHLPHNIGTLPDMDLAVILDKTEEMNSYEHDLKWAQEYARLNRFVMVELALGAVREVTGKADELDSISCHHNYWERETHFGEELFVTRKGAIRADEADDGIIPGAMGRKTYLVRGKGCKESLLSAAHGAGRRMSRNAAKKKYDVDMLRDATLGLVCPKGKSVVDEIPFAYKNIEEVMAWQADLVEILEELTPLLCMKGE